MRDQSKANNLNYLIDPAFNKVNRSFVLSLKMKKMEYLFQSIMLQSWTKKIQCINWWKNFFDVPITNKKSIRQKHWNEQK